MATSLAIPQTSKRPAVIQQPTVSQTTAIPPDPPMVHLTAAKMGQKPSHKHDHKTKAYANNPFLSPNTSEAWCTDDESGSSSGQDEFHLERYSQDTDRTAQRSMEESTRHGKLGSRSRKAKRPDLNVITELPVSQARVFGKGVVLEQVKAKKAATSRPKSVVSAKAEHVQEPFPLQRTNALTGLKDAATRRHERNKKHREVHGSARIHELPADSHVPTANIGRSRERTDQKPVVIGISIPKEEAEGRNIMVGDESAVTLRTPSIIVTPAGAEPPWSTSPLSIKRPTPSFYPTTTPTTNGQGHGQNVPPVPQMPATFSNFSRPQAKAQFQSDAKQEEEPWDHRDSMDGLDAEPQHGPPYPDDSRRFSSESQERILPSGTDPARHKSQGWWNLMLSPMLSRAGTHKSTTSRAPTASQAVPPLPTASERKRSRSATLDSQISPETPRRLGLASARASTWSRWTTWEKQKDHSSGSPEETGEKAIEQPKTNQILNSGSTVPLMIAPSSHNQGLAAEYYRACAIEQLSGESYFECQNHSCAEKLPSLHSIFDRGVPTGTPKATGTAGRALGGNAGTEVGHAKSLSDPTNVVSLEDLSPNVRHADAAPVVNAKAVGSAIPSPNEQPLMMREPQRSRSIPEENLDRTLSPAPIPMPSPTRPQAKHPHIAAIVPPQHPVHAGATVASPGPLSPEMHRNMVSQGAVPMSEIRSVHSEPQPQGQAGMPATGFYNYVNYPKHEAGRDAPANVHIYNAENKPSPQIKQKPAREEVAREERKDVEKEQKPSLISRLKSCAKKRNGKSSSTITKREKKRWAILIGTALLFMVIGCVVLATQLTRRGDRTPAQQQWLNLTGYPPMPTGISTIIRPDMVKEQSQCVSPSTLWSCSLPKENQAEVAPNSPDQPNFRFEIKFRNGTVPSNMTIPVSSDILSKRANDPFTNELFTPNPSPPSRADQLFLGNTTDNITEPFDGEKTPFFMTFIPAFPIDPSDPAINATTNTSLSTRDLTSRQNQNLSSAIPSPATQPDGSAAAANLLPTDPFPFAQPIRLYNRGLQDEHYGFYMYFDKSIFLSSSSPLQALNSSSTTKTKRQATNDTITDDGTGGALRQDARARCTFAQTRFLVRIYTNPSFPAALLGPINHKLNSAINYTPPGSFPYPTSLGIDRHGGNINKKLVYCYGVDAVQEAQNDVKSVVAENRAVAGTIVNPAPGLVEFQGEAGGEFDQDAGGIDGGTGGCACSWQNWQ